MPRKRKTLEERFWPKVDVQDLDECWEWQGARTIEGYGQFWAYGKVVPAHRVAWELAYGSIPKGLLVCHHCDSKSCINPSHLFVGTHTDNFRDAIQKGRIDGRGSQNPNAKLTEEQVVDIRKRYAMGGITQEELAREYGVNHVTVSYIVIGKTWKHIK